MKNLIASVILILSVSNSYADSAIKETVGYCSGKGVAGAVIDTIAGIKSTELIINIKLNRMKKALQVKIDGEKDSINSLAVTKDIKEVITDTGKSFEDIGDGLSMVAVGEDIETAGEGLMVAEKDFVGPTYSILDKIVNDLALEDQLKADKISLKKIEDVQEGIKYFKRGATVVSLACAAIKQIDKAIDAIDKKVTYSIDVAPNQYIYANNSNTMKSILVSSNNSKDTISDQCLSSFNQVLTDLKDPMTILKNDLDALVAPLTSITNSLELLTPALGPLTTIAHDIKEFKKVFDVLHKYNSDLKHLLKKKIHFKVAGVVVLNYSVQEVMNDWKKIEHKIENTIGLGAAKKYIKDEMSKIIKPIEKKIAKEIKSDIMKIKFKGFDLNDMKSKFNAVKDIEKYLKMEAASIKKDMETLEKWEQQCLPKHDQTASLMINL